MDTDLKFLKILWVQIHLEYLKNIAREYWYIHIYLPGLFQNHDHITFHSISMQANRYPFCIDIEETYLVLSEEKQAQRPQSIEINLKLWQDRSYLDFS